MNQHVEDLISAYLDDECTHEEKIQVEQHLVHCSSCRQLFDDLMQIRSSISQTFQTLDIPERIEQRVITVLEQREFQAFSWWIRGIILFPVLLGIFMLIPIFKWGTALIKGLFHLSSSILQVIPVLISAIPFMSIIISLWAVFLLIVSIWSLRRLLI
jgi:predicted anti-sigma-YlaC factor YlaD